MKEKYCRNCGSELRENANFCTNCGYEKKHIEKEEKALNNPKQYLAIKRQHLFIIIGILVVGVFSAFYVLNQINSTKNQNDTNPSQSASVYGSETEKKGSTPPAETTVKPTVSPTVKPTQPDGILGNYSIQLGAFSKKENAQNCLTKAQNAGFSNCRMEMSTDSGKNLYHVSIDGFQTVEAANEKLDKVQSSGFNDAFVIKN